MWSKEACQLDQEGINTALSSHDGYGQCNNDNNVILQNQPD